MEIGIKLLYMMAFGKHISVSSIFHELTRMSPVFYYLDKNGITANKLEALNEPFN